MHLHQVIKIKGCITQEHFIKGKTLPELERLLGFQKGRLENGIIVFALVQLPTIDDFELLGYSQAAEHNFDSSAIKVETINKLKEVVLKESFTLAGHKRLVKVWPNTSHDDNLDNDIQYPPGLGVPQWKLTNRIAARVVEIVGTEEVYY